MTPLDTRTFPLTGASLIEASAGTGKTYTIVNLYLRLILGHGCAPLGVEQILVVTFTNAATAELKDRIRQKLHQAYLDFYQGASDDDFIAALIADADDPGLATERLALAAKMMDEAAVFTIHSFCQQMLTQHAFESGILYEQTLITDENQWQQMAVGDYWRKYIVSLPSELLQQLLNIWSGPVQLLAEIRSLIHRPDVLFTDISVEDASACYGRYVEAVQDVKRWWLEEDIASQLMQAKLKKTTKLGKGPVLLAMTEFCHSASLLPDFDKAQWNAFSTESIKKASGTTSESLEHLDFSRFDNLQSLLNQAFSALKSAFSQQALAHVRSNLASTKQRLNLLAPDDLLLSLRRALSADGSENLADAIAGGFPAALIDEFQDTDSVQFGIFRTLYTDRGCWIMIGDPKQAIYGFRGADIFTYIEAKRLVPQARHFTLDYNWRSQAALVNATNRLFADSEKGFMFDTDIPFHAVSPAKQEKTLELNGQALASLEFMLCTSDEGKALPWNLASESMAVHTASRIAELLNGPGQIDGRTLQAGDCCVLVRDRDEAALVKSALGEAGIASVFLVRKSVFATPVAEDLFRILSAIANPHDERALKAALASDLLGIHGAKLDALFGDEMAWQTLVEQCFNWQRQWRQYGIMYLLSRLEGHFEIALSLISRFDDGSRRLTDFRHLGELLQQQSQLMPSESQLLHWYATQLLDPDHNSDGQQLRLDTDANLVQIITIHASKGLEFPLVFIPFAARYRSNKSQIYHDDSGRLWVDFDADEDTLQTADFERLAEDIRLFYVAVTRAVYHCEIGLWNSAKGSSQKVSGLKSTAIGRLLLRHDDEPGYALLLARLQTLQQGVNMGIREVSPQAVAISYCATDSTAEQHYAAARLKAPIVRNWHLTSYSAISRQQAHELLDQPGYDEGVRPARMDVIDTMDRFGFVRGAQAGSFLHGVLENISFVDPGNILQVIEQQGQWFGIETQWYSPVQSWLLDVLKAPVCSSDTGQAISLSQLDAQSVRAEMEFHLPLKQVSSHSFNRLLNQYFPGRPRQYDFDRLNGMLKGFIDLTFEVDGKFYVADYKSNYLGHDFDSYREPTLEHAMEEHDYTLQAILYTLALHRFLRNALPDYAFDKHIGGALYLFLRGMSADHPGVGVHRVNVPEALVMQLDALFDGQVVRSESDGQGGQLALW